MIFCKDVWFNPPRDPIVADNTIIVIIISGILFIVNDDSIRGAIFCHVIIIILFIQFNPLITLGNQKWKGAAPNFNIKADTNIIVIIPLFIISFMYSVIDTIIDINRTEEARAWVRKYFSAASVDIKLFLAVIRGINASKLISNPIQALSHEVDDTDKIVPLIIIVKNMIFDELLKIKKKRIITFIDGV